MNKIIAIAGDGIGPEIMDVAISILDKISEKFNFSFEIEKEYFGGASIDRYGIPFRDELKDKILKSDAILLGAIGGPKWDTCEVTPEKGLLALRKSLKVFANVRPLKVNDRLAYLSPLKEEIVKGTDLVIVRELLGGAYFGEPRYLEETKALDSITYTYEEIKQIVDYAFKIAMTRRKKVTSVDKANVLATSKLWRKVVMEVSKSYPEVVLEHRYVDAMAMELITKPSSFDVVVTENLFGDILSDEASVLGGSLGLLSSGSFSKNGPALYEPAHGSAPDIAGMGIANPVAMILSLSMMFKYSFKREDISKEIEKIVDKMLLDGYMTKDLNSEKYITTKEWEEKFISMI